MDSHERSDSHSVTGTGYFVNSNAPTSSFIHAMTSCNGINHPRNRIHVRKPFNVESVYVFGKKKKTNLNSVLFFRTLSHSTRPSIESHGEIECLSFNK